MNGRAFKLGAPGVLAVKFPTVFGRLRQKRNPNQGSEKMEKLLKCEARPHFMHGKQHGGPFYHGFHGEYNLVLTDDTPAR
jgi:hypothetical protein